MDCAFIILESLANVWLAKLLSTFNNSKLMKAAGIFGIVLAVGPFLPSSQPAERNPVGWACIARDSVEVRAGPSPRKRVIARLGRGALVELYESRSGRDGKWTQVRLADLATFEARQGWVDSSAIETFSRNRFPPGADLLKALGGEYLEDFVKTHIQIARFLAAQSGAEPLLVCFLGTQLLPRSRLQIFAQQDTKFVPQGFVEFPFAAMKSGIAALEVRDLVGDGNACLVSHEPFDYGSEHRGVKLVIRRIRGGRFERLWEAPLEYRNLASFPPRHRILEPRDRNIGTPGTLTRGTVEFRRRGRVDEPVWKGTVEFHSVGREEPVETIEIEKPCPWEGTQFRALM